MQADRELLLATARRHAGGVSTEVLCALSAAADELVDPLMLPAGGPVDPAATEDLAGVVSAVLGRLRRQDPAELRQAAACARAARELSYAQPALTGRPPDRPDPVTGGGR